MQRVVHQYRNCSRVFTILESIYAQLSDTDGSCTDIIWVTEAFRDLCEILSSNIFSYTAPPIKELPISIVPYENNRENEITVCLSGGKDSAAAAYYYKQRGYTVHLYHAVGVNKAYGDEKKAAQQIADYLKCDLFIETIHIAGLKSFIEHPLKNYVIANAAIHYCMANNYPLRIAFGNFSGSHLDDNAFEVCAGDCVEMWDAYKKIVTSVLPSFQLELPLNTNADTFDLLSEDWELFKLCVSCMSPYRFRAHWKHRTEQKYGVRIFDNRCGSCWKDCIESIWLMDKCGTDYNEEFYRHCIGILLQTIYKESGEKVDIQTCWGNYMFYPITESHAVKYLTGYTIKYFNNKACHIEEVCQSGI